MTEARIDNDAHGVEEPKRSFVESEDGKSNVINPGWLQAVNLQAARVTT